MGLPKASSQWEPFVVLWELALQAGCQNANLPTFIFEQRSLMFDVKIHNPVNVGEKITTVHWSHLKRCLMVPQLWTVQLKIVWL